MSWILYLFLLLQALNKRNGQRKLAIKMFELPFCFSQYVYSSISLFCWMNRVLEEWCCCLFASGSCTHAHVQFMWLDAIFMLSLMDSEVTVISLSWLQATKTKVNTWIYKVTQDNSPSKDPVGPTTRKYCWRDKENVRPTLVFFNHAKMKKRNW